MITMRTMRHELEKKVDQAVHLIEAAGSDGQTVEVAYSGGKDSDVILALTRMAGINYRAIYKNTTIDPPGTIAHAKAKGVEILRPRLSFFQLIEKNGVPNRFYRFCCSTLKEYKVLNRCIMGVRRVESIKRAKRYSEPTECRFYGSKKEYVEAFYPILSWTNQDIVDFITSYNVDIHPLYFCKDGSIDPQRRLGCLCCPLMSNKKRLAEFRKYPRMVKAYIKAMQKFLDTHPNSPKLAHYTDVYKWAVREFFFNNQCQWEESLNNIFGNPDYKQFLMDYFKIEL